MKKLVISSLALTLGLLTGCAGYHTGVSKPHQLAEVKKLAVPTFRNETLDPRLEVLVTNAVIKQIQAGGAYKIVQVKDADAVLRATITDITRRQFRANRNNTLRTSELQVGLVVRYRVEGADGDVKLQGQARENSELVLDPNFQVTETQALAVSAERLGATIASEVSEGW